jgi:hypothetical protein
MISHGAVLVLERKSNESARDWCVVLPRCTATNQSRLDRQHAAPEDRSTVRLAFRQGEGHISANIVTLAANTRARKRRRACIAL